jgi:hypothetical protein
MEKYLLLWEFDRTKIPVDPKERGVGFNMLMEVITQDIKKGILKDWGLFVGQHHGYSVVQGTEVEVIKASQRYTPFVYFAAHPIASVNHAGEMMKVLTR